MSSNALLGPTLWETNVLLVKLVASIATMD